MLEPKALFSTKGPVPKGEYFVPFGVANIVRAGSDLTIVSCGTPLHRAVEAAELLAREGISCEVIDLRTIVPLDVETIAESVAKTGHLLVVDEAFAMCGIGAEIAAAMMELAFDELDAPVGRVHTDPTAHPFSPIHEAAVVISTDRVVAGARAVLAGRPIVPRRVRGVRPGAGSTAGRSSAAAAPASPAAAQPKPVVSNGQSSKVASKTGVAVIMPNQDLTITEGKVIGWGKKVGDSVVKGETVAEIETDKAVIAIEAPATGRLVEIVAPVETVVALGQTIGIVEPT
jgi:2-oxoisovalerate dehydrogenase E1 component